MCGRTSLTATPEELAEAFGLDEVPALVPRYNIAPSQPLPVIRADARARRRTLGYVRWGLVPAGTPDPTREAPLINARAETVAVRGPFRESFRQRRCLVPASAFFEWRRRGTSRQPYLIRRRDGRPLGLAGLWDRWMPGEGGAGPLETAAIVTTDANEVVAPIHDRMPVIVDPSDYERWLDPGLADPQELERLLRPYPAVEMVAVPVSARVNSPVNDDAECVRPISEEEAEDPQRSLF